MGREWNDRLARRLTDSIYKASDNPQPVKLLVTDLIDSRQTLVEIIAEDGDGLPGALTFRVVGEFLVTPKRRPKVLRYRDEQGWPK
jgi:hypothetical protein